MKLLTISKYILAVVAIGLLFIDWKIAIAVFLFASILHVIPLGPNPLLSVITGYLIIGGFVYLFIDWRIGVALIVAGFLVTKFRIWGNKKNFEYYHGKNNSENSVDKIGKEDAENLKNFVRDATSQELFEKEVEHNLGKNVEKLKMLAPYNKAAAQALEIKMSGKWKLEGWDVFDAGNYKIDGEYDTEEQAIEVAKMRLLELERDQSTETSGGQSDKGIQDRIFIVGPDGSKYRYLP